MPPMRRKQIRPQGSRSDPDHSAAQHTRRYRSAAQHSRSQFPPINQIPRPGLQRRRRRNECLSRGGGAGRCAVTNSTAVTVKSPRVLCAAPLGERKRGATCSPDGGAAAKENITFYCLTTQSLTCWYIDGEGLDLTTRGYELQS